MRVRSDLGESYRVVDTLGRGGNANVYLVEANSRIASSLPGGGLRRLRIDGILKSPRFIGERR